jgi:hypothetical protein
MRGDFLIGVLIFIGVFALCFALAARASRQRPGPGQNTTFPYDPGTNSWTATDATSTGTMDYAAGDSSSVDCSSGDGGSSGGDCGGSGGGD